MKRMDHSSTSQKHFVTKALTSTPPSVVLLDLSMPVLDGIGATAEIRRIESGFTAEFSHRRSRILALTGMSSLEDKRRAFDAGVDG